MAAVVSSFLEGPNATTGPVFPNPNPNPVFQLIFWGYDDGTDFPSPTPNPNPNPWTCVSGLLLSGALIRDTAPTPSPNPATLTPNPIQATLTPTPTSTPHDDDIRRLTGIGLDWSSGGLAVIVNSAPNTAQCVLLDGEVICSGQVGQYLAAAASPVVFPSPCSITAAKALPGFSYTLTTTTTGTDGSGGSSSSCSRAVLVAVVGGCRASLLSLQEGGGSSLLWTYEGSHVYVALASTCGANGHLQGVASGLGSAPRASTLASAPLAVALDASGALRLLVPIAALSVVNRRAGATRYAYINICMYIRTSISWHINSSLTYLSHYS